MRMRAFSVPWTQWGAEPWVLPLYFYGIEGLLSRMTGGKGDVIGGMPILGAEEWSPASLRRLVAASAFLT